MKKSEEQIFKLVAMDMTHLGGMMGSEYTTTIFTKYFRKVENAQEHAQKDYRKRCKGARGRFKWGEYAGGGSKLITSGDLNFIMYDISPIKLED